MKLLSLLTLTALLSVTACSHHRKSCCAGKEKVSCCKEKCDKKDAKKCDGQSCEKKKS